MGRVSKVWKCGGIIVTLNYSFTIQTIGLNSTIWYSNSVHFQNPNLFSIQYFVYFQIPNIFSIRSKISIRPNTATDWKASRVDACSQTIKIHV